MVVRLLPSARHAVPLAALATLHLACSGDDSGGAGGSTGAPRLTDSAAATAREACEFKSGAMPVETLGRSDRLGKDIPVEHVFVMMMENRSFDHYFMKLPEYGQPDVKVAPATYTNPDTAGSPVSWFHTSEYCVEDPDHGWEGSHVQFGDGKNDGFVVTNDPDGARALGYLDQTDLPFYYELANTYAISDSYFCSLLGPTWPNRMYLYAGSSYGLTKNSLPVAGDSPSVYSAMIEKGLEWRVYRSNLAPAAMFINTWIDSIAGCQDPELGPCRVADISTLYADLASGNLPPLVFIEPEYNSGITETSEHPPGNPHHGQHLAWSVVDALGKSPVWSKSALFLTYDEHGGFADHVPPPPACHPGNGSPDDTSHGDFDRLGFRVPVFVISPFAKQHFVSHEVHSHTSILRFIQAKFELPALTGRDANSDAMMDFFDFDSPPFTTPPPFAEPPVDAAKVARCEELFP
ncbi:MAG: alkaline phosphatase family protein [Polyangiaceae bacterium]|nr:alkaline phosphatase family protein [Polyangiaceae bacterium]